MTIKRRDFLARAGGVLAASTALGSGAETARTESAAAHDAHTVPSDQKSSPGASCDAARDFNGSYARSAHAIPNGEKPNVIIINADDLGYGDVGAYGATMVNTPNIDRLAREGRRFTDFHSASAVCSPSRYALLTGEYPARRNLWGPLGPKDALVIDPSRTTLARVMKEAGYSTAVIGKWHLGFGAHPPVDWNKELKPGPLELGFDYYFGVPVVNCFPPYVYVENYRVVGLEDDDPLAYGETAKTREFDEKFSLNQFGGGDAAHALYKDREIAETLTHKVVQWIKANKNKPFFLYLAPTNIHHPFTPAPRFIASSRAGAYGDSVQELDWMVGEVLATLDKEELDENTLVIFTSDNGGMFNRGGQTAWEAGHRLNGHLLGAKFGAWEGGHRVPCIARWPGKIPAGTTYGELLSNIDMMATLASLVGINLKRGEAPDSFDMLPALTGAPEKPIRDFLIISPASPEHLSIRKGRWMYIPAQGDGGFIQTEIGQHAISGAAVTKLTKQHNSDIEYGEVKQSAPPAQLYDLEADPTQAVNLYEHHREMVHELHALLKASMDASGARTPDRQRSADLEGAEK